jgi:hypothetical protein
MPTGMFVTVLQTAGSTLRRADLPRGRSAEPDEPNAPPAWAAALRTRSRPLGRLDMSLDMHKFSLAALGHQLRERVGAAGGGHTADTVVGGHERILRQTVMRCSRAPLSPSTRTRARRPCTSCADESGCRPGTCPGGRPGDLFVVPDARPAARHPRRAAVCSGRPLLRRNDHPGVCGAVPRRGVGDGPA